MEAWPGACSLPEEMWMNSMLAMVTCMVALMMHNITELIVSKVPNLDYAVIIEISLDYMHVYKF